MKNLSTVWCLGSDPQPPERPYTKLQSCHCEEQSDLAIYAIEPALVRHNLNMLLFPLVLYACLSLTAYR